VILGSSGHEKNQKVPRRLNPILCYRGMKFLASEFSPGSRKLATKNIITNRRCRRRNPLTLVRIVVQVGKK